MISTLAGIIFSAVLILGGALGIMYATAEYAYYCGMSAAHDEVMAEWDRDINRLHECVNDHEAFEKRQICIDKDNEISTLLMDKEMKFKLSDVIRKAINDRKRSEDCN